MPTPGSGFAVRRCAPVRVPACIVLIFKRKEAIAMLLRDLIPFVSAPPLTGERRRLDPFNTMQREMSRMFEDAWKGFEWPVLGNGGEGGLAAFAPKVDVSETDKDIQVTAELPGMEEKDIDVVFADGVLTIQGERKTETEKKDEDKRYFLRECSYGTFRRDLPLGDSVDDAKVKATFKNGTLTVTLQKTKEAKAKEKHIPITH